MDKVLSRGNLHPYQRKASDWVVDRADLGSALWLEMGLGKTGSTIDALSRLHDSFEMRKTLVIAPKRVAQHTWPKELRTWEQARDMPHLVLDAAGGEHRTVGAAIEAKLQDQEHPVHLVGVDNVKTVVQAAKAAKHWPYDTVVIDESSRFKNAASRRWRSLCSALPLVRRAIELTGSPSPNGYMDLWAQLYLIDQGERLGRGPRRGTGIGAYRDRWFNFQHQPGAERHVGKWVLKPGAKAEIDARLADICISMQAADYLDLPGRVDNPVEIPLPAALRKRYDEFEREYVLQLEDTDLPVAAGTAAVLGAKLRQFCNGALYTEKGKWSEVHGLKLEAMEDIVAGAGGPVLVGYQFKSDNARLQQKFGDDYQHVDTPGALDAWDRGEIPILGGHPASMGHGLNMQSGGHTLVHFGLDWNWENYAQIVARLDRQGQTRTVMNHQLVIADSIESRVAHVLRGKQTSERSLLDAVKWRAEG